MLKWRRLAILVAVSGLLLGFGSAAFAADCGTAPAGGGDAPKGALTLRDAESKVDLDFGRDNHDERLILVFDVEGCVLANSSGLVARPIASKLEPTVFGTPTVTAKGSLLTVELPVHPKFPPGEYKLSVAVSGPTVATAITRGSVKRTEDRALIPWGIWFGGVVVGVAWAGYTIGINSTEKKKGKLQFHLEYLPFALVAALGGAYLVLKQSYLDADVIWRFTWPNAMLLLVGAAIAAAGASTAGPLAKAIVRVATKKKQAVGA